MKQVDLAQAQPVLISLGELGRREKPLKKALHLGVAHAGQIADVHMQGMPVIVSGQVIPQQLAHWRGELLGVLTRVENVGAGSPVVVTADRVIQAQHVRSSPNDGHCQAIATLAQFRLHQGKQ